MSRHSSRRLRHVPQQPERKPLTSHVHDPIRCGTGETVGPDSDHANDTTGNHPHENAGGMSEAHAAHASSSFPNAHDHPTSHDWQVLVESKTRRPSGASIDFPKSGFVQDVTASSSKSQCLAMGPLPLQEQNSSIPFIMSVKMMLGERQKIIYQRRLPGQARSRRPSSQVAGHSRRRPLGLLWGLCALPGVRQVARYRVRWPTFLRGER